MIGTRRRGTPWLAFAGLVAATAFADPLPVHASRLANGLQVLVFESHALPLVTVELAFRSGSMTEGPEANGLSHLYEHLFFKPTATLRDPDRFTARTRELGMALGGSTGTERVHFFFSTAREHLEPAMALLCDAAVSPLFDPREIDRERTKVIEELDRAEATPDTRFQLELSQRVWWMFPTLKAPLGRKDAVLKATRHKLKTFQERFYIPNNAALIVTGDVRPDEISSLARKLFGRWKAGADPFKRDSVIKHPPLVKSEVVVLQQPVEAVRGQLVWHGPSTVGKGAEHAAAAELSGYLFSEPSSRFQRAVLAPGACARADLRWEPQMNVGPVTLDIEAPPGSMDGCLKVTFGELPKMKSPDYFSDEELRSAARRLEVDRAHERERPSELAHVLSLWWAMEGLPYYLRYEDGVRKVTRKEIASYLTAYVVGRPLVLGVTVSPSMVVDLGLDARHFEVLLDAGETRR